MPSSVVYLVILWVSSFIVCLLPTLFSGEDTLTILGGEYDGDLLLARLLEVLVLVLEVQACRCSEPRVDALVLALALLLGVGDLLDVVPLGVGDL